MKLYLVCAAAMMLAGAGCGGAADGYETEARATPPCGAQGDAGAIDAEPEAGPSADLCSVPPVGSPGCRSVLGWPENPCGLPAVDGGLVCCCTY